MKKIIFFNIFKNLFDYSGKENRHDFIINYLIFLFISLIVLISNIILMIFMIKNDLSYGKYYFNRESIILFELFVLCVIIMFLCSSLLVRRINDIGISKKIFLFLLIPILGFVYISLNCLILRGSNDCSIPVRKRLTKRIFFINILSYISVLLIIVICLLVKYGKDDLSAYIEMWEPTYILDKNIDNYDKNNSFYDKYNLLPELSIIGQFDSLDYACKQVRDHAFTTLKITYEDEKFEEAKNIFDNYMVTNDKYVYSYLETEIMYNKTMYIFPVASFSYKDYKFRILPVCYKTFSDGIIHYYNDPFLMVGTNLKNKSFVFLYWYGKQLVKTTVGQSEKIKISNMNKTCDYFYWFN